MFLPRIRLCAGLLLGGLAAACADAPVEDPEGDAGKMTMSTTQLDMRESENGCEKYRFVAPLVEEYEYAKEPYREFRQGVDVTTFRADSAGVVDTHMTGDYAINYTDRRLWEARGNVHVLKSNGEQLHTQQLFWNERTGRIWSNVDSRIVQQGGLNMLVEGWESDQSLGNWSFRRAKGSMLVDIAPTEEKTDSVAAGGAPTP